MTIGADAAAAAGPVGRQTAAATDGKLQAEIYTYSRSRGLFAGVSIDGSVVRIDQLATGAYYHSAGPGQPLIVPPSAQQLTQTVAAYASGSPSEPPATSATGLPGLSPVPAEVPQVSNLQPSSIVQQHRATNADVIRNQLTQTAPELYELVDEGWKNYLALPSQVFLTGPHPSSAEVGAALERFNRVATDPAFAKLAARPEFQSVHAMLKHYQQSLNPQTSNLPLPAPPDFGAPPIH